MSVSPATSLKTYLQNILYSILGDLNVYLEICCNLFEKKYIAEKNILLVKNESLH